MPELIIKLEGDGALNDVPTETVVHVTAPVTVTALDRGMTSGKPSMAFIIPLPNGQTVLAETSMALFHAAAKAFAARYGWQA